jgi:putative transposase
MLKKYGHNPTHLFLDDTRYFITAAIWKKRPLLKNHELKVMLSETFKGVFQRDHWQLHHWVILDNHYHLLGQS